MFTPAERKGGQAYAQLPATGSSAAPVPFQGGTYPWVQREPHSMACGNMASRCARHKQRKGGCSGPRGGLSRAPWAFPPDRLPGVSIHWPGLMGLGRIRGGLACQNCHCGQGDRARAGQGAVVLPSPPPPKAQGPPAQLRLPKSWLVWGPPDRWSWEWATKVAFGGPPGRN